jgi:hypothetical protein
MTTLFKVLNVLKVIIFAPVLAVIVPIIIILDQFTEETLNYDEHE